MPRVKLTCARVAQGETFPAAQAAGEVIEVDEAEARRMIAGRYAEAVETASQRPPEHAARRTKPAA